MFPYTLEFVIRVILTLHLLTIVNNAAISTVKLLQERVPMASQYSCTKSMSHHSWFSFKQTIASNICECIFLLSAVITLEHLENNLSTSTVVGVIQLQSSINALQPLGWPLFFVLFNFFINLVGEFISPGTHPVLCAFLKFWPKLKFWCFL